MQDLITAVKDKKELRGVSDEFVEKVLQDYLDKHPNALEKKDKPHFQRSREYRAMVKEVRAVLREVYGAFILTNYERMRKAIADLNNSPTLVQHKAVLGLHRSSKERLPYYDEIYDEIFAITGKPKRIMDLACGLNPFSYPWLDCKPEYLAADISPVLMEFIQGYFDAQGIQGNSFVFDLLKFRPTDFASYAESDVCFLFKTLDSLETMERGFSWKLVEGLPAKWVVVSFATKSFGGRKEIKERGWFEKLMREAVQILTSYRLRLK
ncbi:hypothetical protein ACFL1B_04075, partial [Nanoarchaeota archaeon]